jgi:hypothetical protein
MLNPGTLLDNIVTQLRLVSGLVTEMGGDATHILAYYDSYPASTNLTSAIYLLPAPAVLVVYDGTSQGGGQMQLWAHSFRLIVKLREPVLTVTKAAATLTSIAVAANVGTVTWPAHGLEAGCSVTLSGATVDTDLNATYIIATAPTVDTFTIPTVAVGNGTYAESTLKAVANTSGAKHYAALHLLVDGIPTGGALNLVDMEINSGCDGMVTVPRFERQSLIIDAAGNQMDYWVCRYVLTEK